MYSHIKEIRSIIDAYRAVNLEQTKAALATVARVEGSSYRRAGARMLVLDDGTFVGGISGGCLEGDALRRAQKAIARHEPSVVTYDTTQEDSHQIGVGLGCNGIIDVLFTPLAWGDERNPVLQLQSLADTRTPRLLLTIVQSEGQKGLLGQSFPYTTNEEFRLRFPVRPVQEEILSDIADCLSQNAPQTKTYTTPGGSLTLFFEVIVPATHLVIYGGNYDIYPVMRIARELGWNLTVVVNPAKADKSLYAPGTRVLSPNGPEQPAIDRFTAVLLMAHDYNRDFSNLRAVLPTGAAYIGLLGPRKRSQKMFDALAAEGNPITEADTARLFSPAGLDIGAATPEEIALSILAEIRAHFAGRPGLPLRERKGTIYGG